MMKCKQRVKDNHPRTPQKLLDPIKVIGLA
jgi:hypothetical protein